MITIILPVYNEAKALPLLLEEIKRVLDSSFHDYLVLVVDDGSTDKTKQIALSFNKSIPLRVISHRTNKGLGVTICTGLKEVVRTCSSEDIIITMDGDNTHSPSYVIEMVNKIKKGYDVVIASRYQPGGKEIGLSFKRKFLSKTVNLLLGTIFPIKGVKDYTCGYRAYKGMKLKEGFSFHKGNLVEEKGFSCMTEILLKLSKLPSLKATEVPMVLRYDLKDGPSKINVYRTIMRYVCMITKSFIVRKS